MVVANPPEIEERDMEVVYARPESMHDAPTHYCPGCGHGIAHRLIGEVLDELGMRTQTIGVAPVGCAVFAFNYLNVDFIEAAHGRAPATATGIKRIDPSRIVFTYQGDGDLASIGIAEILYAAQRGEKFTTVFINNAIYGMTGGQMAPTSLEGMKTTSSPYGRDVKDVGHPVKMAELLAGLPGAAYIARRSLHNVREIRKARKAILKAFKVQQAGLGFSLVELLSNCPTNLGMTPSESMQWVEANMVSYFPLGEYKVAGEAEPL